MLVVAIARTLRVIARVFNGTIRRQSVIEEYEVLVSCHPAIALYQQCRGVPVEVVASSRSFVHPRPSTTAVNPGASGFRLTFPPLVRLTAIPIHDPLLDPLVPQNGRPSSLDTSGPREPFAYRTSGQDTEFDERLAHS